MNTTRPLTQTQQQILTHAIEQSDGLIAWIPPTIKGGARAQVLKALARRTLITTDNSTDWRVTAQGYAQMACVRPPPAQPGPQTRTRQRAHSKQAEVIALLQRPEGATVTQICQTTGWQRHTVRGMFAHVIKKKRQLPLASIKMPGQERVYRIDAALEH